MFYFRYHFIISINWQDSLFYVAVINHSEMHAYTDIHVFNIIYSALGPSALSYHCCFFMFYRKSSFNLFLQESTSTDPIVRHNHIMYYEVICSCRWQDASVQSYLYYNVLVASREHGGVSCGLWLSLNLRQPRCQSPQRNVGKSMWSNTPNCQNANRPGTLLCLGGRIIHFFPVKHEHKSFLPNQSVLTQAETMTKNINKKSVQSSWDRDTWEIITLCTVAA